MRALFRWLRRVRVAYEPLIVVRISRARLEHNFAEFTRLLGPRAVAPVLKSNAYGHGMVLAAKVFARLNPPFMMVDSLYEALVLRNERVTTPLLILGYTSGANIARQRFSDVSFGLIGTQHVQEIVETLRDPRSFHLKLDTGMHRQGVPLEDLDKVIELLKSNHNIHVTGLATHLADADGSTPDFTRTQIKAWNTIVARLKREFPSIQYVHVANTAGTHFAQEIKANVSRVGLGLYGIDTSGTRAGSSKKLDVQPALEVVTKVTSIRTVQPGEHVGYNTTFTAKRPTRVATIPMGYFEGLDRRFSGAGSMTLRGQQCPIIGRVSMNISSIDVTDVPEARVGDEVIVFSQNPEDANSIEKAGARAHIIMHDLLVHIAQHLRRTLV